MDDSRPDPTRGAIRRPPRSGEVVRRGEAQRNPATMHHDEGPSEADLEQFGDATRKCPECGREVYDEAELCPHCGHAFSGEPKGPPVWVVVTAGLVIGAFVLVYVIAAT